MAALEAPPTTKAGLAWKLVRQYLPRTFAALLLLGSALAGYFSPVTASTQLTVIGSLHSAGDHSEIKGRVVQDGDAVGKALVWVIVEYANGQRDSPPATQTDENGGFSVTPVPTTLGTDKNRIVEATIHARKEIPAPHFYRSATTLRGEDRVRAAGTVSQQTVELSPLKLLPLPAIFLISAMLPFIGDPTRLKHVFAIILAFFFTGLMIVYLSLGLKYVNTAGKTDGIIALGFASVYQGTYVKDVQPEWLFSLTAPPPKPSEQVLAETKPAADTAPVSAAPQAGAKPSAPTAPSSGGSTAPAQTESTPAPKIQTEAVPIDHGFGAPLWVLLVSVLGAGVLTMGLIVGEIGDLPDADEADKIRKRLQAIVQHQFYILFAPVGVIFVYQILVVGSAAASDLTVAIAALGAGASLSALVSKAVAYATQVIKGFGNNTRDADGTTQQAATDDSGKPKGFNL